MAHVFVAVQLPAQGAAVLHDALAPLRSACPDARWTPSARWHVTLAFLGDLTTAGRVRGPLALRRASARAEPFSVAVPGQLGRFGKRVLWAAVEPLKPDAGGCDPLGSLAAAIRFELAREQVEFDDRPFRAHLTVARARRGAVLPRTCVVTAPGLPYRWRVGTVALLSSAPAQAPSSAAVGHVNQRGGGYRTIATWPLGGGASDAPAT